MTAVSERILRHILVPAPLPALPAPPHDVLAGRIVLVLNGSVDLRTDIAAAVTGYGGEAVAWDDENGVATTGRPIDVIIDAGLTGLDAAVDVDVWRAPLTRSITALHAVYSDWSKESDARRLHYVALTGMGGHMAISPETATGQPLGGLWAGLAKTLPREFPACSAHVIDLDPLRDAPGDAVVTEMMGGGPVEIGLAGGLRTTVLPRWQDPVGQPIGLSPSDVLVFTGGGRGIGFEIALEMARSTGCHVIVSGRARLRDDESGWLTASAEWFAEIAGRAYADQPPGTSPQQVRREIASMRQTREIVGNLARAERAGAKISYFPCDVTDPAAVEALLRYAGDGLAMVVHNAGVDEPTRLNKKSVEDVIKIVTIKVDGFLHLLRALRDRPLKMLCAVGSLTGRYGGMAGQTDYAAANEALARMATWVAANRPYPVKCLGWPTWNGLGLITNLEAAARYMTPIDVAQGVAAWRRELLTSDSGEIALLGEVGELGPGQLHGVVVPSNWDGRSRLLSERFFLGDVVRYAPMSILETAHSLDPAWASCLYDTTVGDYPATPLSLIAEYLVRGASWLFSPGFAQHHDQEIHDLRIQPEALRPGDKPLSLIRRARATNSGRRWRVDVRLWRVTDSGETLVGACSISPLPDAPDRATETATARRPVGTPVRPEMSAYRWLPYDIEVSPWEANGSSWSAQVTRWRSAEMFALVEPPEPALPLAHLEALAAVSPAAATDASAWSVSWAHWRRDAGTARTIAMAAESGSMRVLDQAGQTVLHAHGAGWSSQVG
jgi:NAD(P)-dependent dehydrogenase (short-subunit alcohol dehydrogenase family)